jgi:hypothetical protein
MRACWMCGYGLMRLPPSAAIDTAACGEPEGLPERVE